MRDRYLAALVAVPFSVAALLPHAHVLPDEVFRFEDPAIVESSGLAVVDGRFVTVNDSGDSARVFSVDPTSGHTVGVSTWSSSAVDVEAVAPGAAGTVWVGDIGDNLTARSSVVVAGPVSISGSGGKFAQYRLRYPGGPVDAETLLRDPITGRLYVVTKEVFGGRLLAVPTSPSATSVNRLTLVGDVLGLATDGAFFPDGRHVVLRNYASATVYEFPSLAQVASFKLPRQQQGEGIAVAPDGTVYVSSEGVRAAVLRVSLPAVVRAALAPVPTASPSSPTPSVPPGPASREGTELPEAPYTGRDPQQWLLGGALAVVALGVLWLALRRGSP